MLTCTNLLSCSVILPHVIEVSFYRSLDFPTGFRPASGICMNNVRRTGAGSKQVCKIGYTLDSLDFC